MHILSGKVKRENSKSSTTTTKATTTTGTEAAGQLGRSQGRPPIPLQRFRPQPLELVQLAVPLCGRFGIPPGKTVRVAVQLRVAVQPFV